MERHRLIAHRDFDAQLVQRANQCEVGIIDAVKLLKMRIIQRGGRGIAGHRHHKLQLFGRYASGDVQIDHARHTLQPEVRPFDIAFIAGQLEHHFVAQPHRRFKRGVGFIMNFAVARDRRRAPEPVRIGGSAEKWPAMR